VSRRPRCFVEPVPAAKHLNRPITDEGVAFGSDMATGMMPAAQPSPAC
jgi:hypothetical protein